MLPESSAAVVLLTIGNRMKVGEPRDYLVACQC